MRALFTTAAVLVCLAHSSTDVELDARGLMVLENIQQHSECKLISQVAFGPSRVKYDIPNIAPSNAPAACQTPNVPALNTTAAYDSLKHSNRVEFTLTRDHLLYKTHLLPYSSLTFANDISNIQPIEWLQTYGGQLTPGIYTLRARFYVCAIESQNRLVAPLQYEADLCIQVRDTFRPRAHPEHQCPSPPQASRTYVDGNTTYPLFDFAELDTQAYRQYLDTFTAFSNHIQNAPCIDGNLGKRCDEVADRVTHFDGATVVNPLVTSDFPTLFDHVSEAEFAQLKQVVTAMQLSEPLPIQKQECVRCVYRERQPKEIISTATCEFNPPTTESCVGDAEHACRLGICQAAKPTDLYAAELTVSDKYVALSKTYQHGGAYVEGEVHLCGHDGVVTFNVRELVAIRNERRGEGIRYRYQLSTGSRQTWHAMVGNRMERQTLHQTLTTVRVTVEGWTACGRLLTWEAVLIMHQLSTPHHKPSRYRPKSEPLRPQQRSKHVRPTTTPYRSRSDRPWRYRLNARRYHRSAPASRRYHTRGAIRPRSRRYRAPIPVQYRQQRRYTLSTKAQARAATTDKSAAQAAASAQEDGEPQEGGYTKYIAFMAIGVFVIIIGLAVLCGRCRAHTVEDDMLTAKYTPLH